jgi:hypothetical protein
MSLRRAVLAGLVAVLAACGIGRHGMAGAEAKLDIKEIGPDGLPIIFWRIKQENEAAVFALLNAGADIEAQGYHGATPILSAALIDNWPLVVGLIERGANVGAVDRRGFNLPYFTTQASPDPDGPTGAALQTVRLYLNERLMLERVYAPAEVRDLMAKGTWPPK